MKTLEVESPWSTLATRNKGREVVRAVNRVAPPTAMRPSRNGPFLVLEWSPIQPKSTADWDISR